MVNMCLRIYTEKVPSVKCNISWNWTCNCVVHHPKFCKIKDLQFCSYNKRGLINGPYSVVTIRNILIHTCIIFIILLIIATSSEDLTTETEGGPAESSTEREGAREGENAGGQGRQKVTVSHLATVPKLKSSGTVYI